MTAERQNAGLRIVPRGMRSDCREEQIKAIKAQIRDTYAERIRAATTRDEKRALKAKRDAEIARQVKPLIREQNLDTPECL